MGKSKCANPGDTRYYTSKLIQLINALDIKIIKIILFNKQIIIEGKLGISKDGFLAFDDVTFTPECKFDLGVTVPNIVTNTTTKSSIDQMTTSTLSSTGQITQNEITSTTANSTTANTTTASNCPNNDCKNVEKKCNSMNSFLLFV